MFNDDDDYDNDLIFYCKRYYDHDIKMIKRLAQKVELLTSDYAGCNALMYYCARDTIDHDIEIIDFLSQAIGVEYTNGCNANALMIYCSKTLDHNIEIIKLLSQNVDLTHANDDGYNALMFYCKKTRNHDIEIIKHLSQGVDLNCVTSAGYNAFMLYFMNGVKKYDIGIITWLCVDKKSFDWFIKNHYNSNMVIPFNDINHIIIGKDKIEYEKIGVKFTRYNDKTKQLHHFMKTVPIDACNIIQEYLR